MSSTRRTFAIREHSGGACAALVMAVSVVLARCSAPDRVRSAATAAPAAERGSVCPGVGVGGLRARDRCCTPNGILRAMGGHQGQLRRRYPYPTLTKAATPPSAAVAWYLKREGSNVAASAPIRRASSSTPRSAPIEQQPWPSSATGWGRTPRQPLPPDVGPVRGEERTVEAPRGVAVRNLDDRWVHGHTA